MCWLITRSRVLCLGVRHAWRTDLGERQVQGWNGVMLELVLGEEYGPEEDPVALGVRKQTQQLKTGGERKAVTGARATQGHRFQLGSTVGCVV